MKLKFAASLGNKLHFRRNLLEYQFALSDVAFLNKRSMLYYSIRAFTSACQCKLTDNYIDIALCTTMFNDPCDDD